MSNMHHIGPNMPGEANVQVTLDQAKDMAARQGFNRAFVILSSDDEDFITRSWLNAGMTMAELVGLLTIIKHQILEIIMQDSEYV